MTISGLTFYFGGMPVGRFREGDAPHAPGGYSYEPFRGLGHYDMQTCLGAGGSPRCYYEAEGQNIAFTVNACSEYGVLELCDFEFTPLKTA
jgi:hypothetical protein